MSINVTKDELEQLILEAIKKLPRSIQRKLENVEFVLEDAEAPYNLFGLYQGVPHTKRGENYTWVLPDKITLYKKTIERYARDKKELAHHVQEVVLHEIAHHFGFSEEDIRRLKRK